MNAIQDMTTRRVTVWSAGNFEIVAVYTQYEFEDGSTDREVDGHEAWRTDGDEATEIHWLELPREGQKFWNSLE